MKAHHLLIFHVMAGLVISIDLSRHGRAPDPAIPKIFSDDKSEWVGWGEPRAAAAIS